MVLKGVLSGIRAARKGKLPHSTFQNLTYTPYLYGKDHLFHLYDHAEEEQKEMIHDYLHGKFQMNHDVSSLGDYGALNEFLEKDLKIGNHAPKTPKSHYKKSVFSLDDFKGDW